MTYDRLNTGPWAWLKSVGSADEPLEDLWLAERDYLLRFVWFPKHPRSLRGGDLLVYYAAGRGVLAGVVRLRSDEVQKAGDHPRYSDRWPWRMEVEPLLVVPNLEDAPLLADTGIDSLRVRRQSHILLTEAEIEAVRRAFIPPVSSAA